MTEQEIIRQAMSAMGKRSWEKRKEKLMNSNHFSEMGKKSAEARRKRKENEQ